LRRQIEGPGAGQEQVRRRLGQVIGGIGDELERLGHAQPLQQGGSIAAGARPMRNPRAAASSSSAAAPGNRASAVSVEIAST
jgi:hypothetical protein